MDTSRSIGIIGGMGSEASMHLYRRVIERTEAGGDSGHIPLVILNDPAVPDRSEHLLREGSSFLPSLKDGVNQLKRLDVPVYAVACVTAHAYRETLARVEGITFLDAIEAVQKKLDDRQAVLLSTEGTYAADVFAGLDNLTFPPSPIRRRVHEAIYQLKAAEPRRRVARTLSSQLSRQYARDTLFVLGCTELSLLADALKRRFEVISVLDALADAIIETYQRILAHAE